MTPNFSAFPWEHVPRVSRAQATLETTIARWIGVRSSSADRLRRLLRVDAVSARVVSPAVARDPYAACAVVRLGGVSIEAWCSGGGARVIAQRLLGGPEELDAPRPLGVVEQSMWSLVVATALEDLGVAGEVWPLAGAGTDTGSRVGLDVRLDDVVVSVEVVVPGELVVRLRPPAVASWTTTFIVDAQLVLGRCALHRDDLGRLAPRQVITLDRPVTGIDLDLLGGTLGLQADSRAISARVVTGYVRRDMSLPDDAHVELTVALGTTQLSLRQVVDLAVGQIVPLGRPLAGPFEVRAEGRVVGRGELVDVDGELAVRIVSLGD